MFGRLGVLGNANLFLLNPNGIMFGPNSSLDIKGSFLATTANSIKLGESGFFSASEPQNSRLISVSPGALFFNQVANQPATITNSGNLAVGQNFTLAAGNLDLQGQLYAGKNLTLQAQNTVKVRDSVASTFIASTGGQLLIQGNQGVNIFALNHPASGLFSGGDMVLRSPSPVLGDARYTTGGNFRIEQLDRSLGNLISPSDPIIQASGNVSFTSYTGRSLHIFAGGSVNIGSVTITGQDPTNSINETLTLSDGTPLTINGSTRPTLDVRAGTTAVASPSGVRGTPTPTGLSLTDTPTSADITIGNITVSAADGLVFLTNQYQPNTALAGGVIQVGKIDTSRRLTGKGGDVVIDSRNTIALSDTLNTSSLLGNGGNVTLLAASDINLSDTLNTSSFQENGGNITLLAASDINLANITSVGQLGGNITLTSNGTISLSDRFILSASIAPSTSALGSKGGDINVSARSLSLTNGARLIAATLGFATGGDINVSTSQSIALSGNDDGLLSDARTIPQFEQFLTTLSQNALEALGRIKGSGLLAVTVSNGSGGNVAVNTGQLSVRDGSEISAYAYNQGNGGNLTINASESVELIGTTPENYVGGVFALTYAAGDSGNTTINTKRLTIRDGSAASASNLLGTGNGGDLTVNATESVELSGSSPDGKVPTNLSAGSAG
ncbi:MAG TPA: filamentous hemagglutinin N-terminal domain-containing protein, partial [Oculatellaceae cyanobacterium]